MNDTSRHDNASDKSKSQRQDNVHHCDDNQEETLQENSDDRVDDLKRTDGDNNGNVGDSQALQLRNSLQLTAQKLGQ